MKTVTPMEGGSLTLQPGGWRTAEDTIGYLIILTHQHDIDPINQHIPHLYHMKEQKTLTFYH